jgi:hypothetical protein
MKTLCTILIVILTVVLGRWIITLGGIDYKVLIKLYPMFVIGVFSYGVYKILESFEK